MAGQSALEMGRRSAASGDTEAGPSRIAQMLNELRDMATIRPSPTGDRLENARRLLPYLMPSAVGEAIPSVRALVDRLRGGAAPAARVVEDVAPAAPTLGELAGSETVVNPAFAGSRVDMPAVVRTVEPTATTAAPGFQLGSYGGKVPKSMLRNLRDRLD